MFVILIYLVSFSLSVPLTKCNHKIFFFFCFSIKFLKIWNPPKNVKKLWTFFVCFFDFFGLTFSYNGLSSFHPRFTFVIFHLIVDSFFGHQSQFKIIYVKWFESKILCYIKDLSYLNDNNKETRLNQSKSSKKWWFMSENKKGCKLCRKRNVDEEEDI